MAAVTTEMVKTLREKTGAGMMDCKRALEESGGDMDKAVEGLRKAGIAKAEKKAGRTTKEGMIFACVEPRLAVFVEILCETDFVARNERFREYGAALARRVAAECAGAGDLSAPVAEAEKGRLAELISVIGENMQIRRVLRWSTADGQFATYNHQSLSKCCVLVEAAGEIDPVVLKDVCLHVAAFSPQYVGPGSVTAEVLEKEKEIAAAQVTGKPANIIEKIVAGKIAKWYTEVCLEQQPWIRDDKTCLAKVAPKLEVRRFVRWQVGESL
jgi:elongation factor Ts